MAIFDRNLTIAQRIFRSVSNAHRAGDDRPFAWDWQERQDSYKRWGTLYDNSIYDDQADGGLREAILTDTIKEPDNTLPLHGYFNPIGPIVDTYQQVLRGQYGRDIKIAAVSGMQEHAAPLNPLLETPVGNIWKWSNLNDQKDVLQYLTANLGTCGLRVETRTTDDSGNLIDPLKRRVRIVPVHPSEIVDFDEDGEGNVIGVTLEYTVLEGQRAENRTEVTYREELDKDSFRKVRGNKELASGPNDMGICPFVLLRHRDNGREFGIPAHAGTENIIHQINWLLSRIGISVDRHVFAKWFAVAGGSRPESFDLGDTTVAYVQANAGDTTPKLEAIVAKLDFIGINNVLMGLIAHIRHRQPELTLSYLEALSGQSGETIAKLLIPCEQRILQARTRYEHAIVRAIQIGLSWGIMLEMWDLGSGMGTAKAAEMAYETGLENFAFNERSALPETVYDKAKRAEADNKSKELSIANAKNAAGITSNSDQLRMMGKTDAEISKIRAEMSQQDAAMGVAQ